jgi:twitching motility protein PilT
MALFGGGVQEALRKLNKGTFASSRERDGLLEAVADADGLRPRDVVWMLFRPDRAVRACAEQLLSTMRSPDTIDVFIAESAGKPEAALRGASATLLNLGIPGIEGRLAQLLQSADESVRDTVRQIALSAPASQAMEPVLWALSDSGNLKDRLAFLERLGGLKLNATSFKRWQQLARSDETEVREHALVVLSRQAPQQSVDLIVAELPGCGYATQQHLITSLSALARQQGTEFAERILPLMASGDAGTRSAVLKILLSMDDRARLVRRYLRFSKTLAGWARDRALESMKEFGADLIEPTLELFKDPDADVRATALVVVGSFEDRSIVPATLPLLQDPDWWIRITAADVLGRLGDPRAVDPLIAAFTDPEARWAAVEALGRIADPRALPALAQLLKDPAAEIRIEVLLALRNFKHPKILEVLQRVASSDPDRIVRGRALEIAEEVAERDQTAIAEAASLRAAALKIEAGAQGEPRLHAMLVATRNQGASDFHLSVGQPPTMRLAADLVAARGEPLTAQQTAQLIREILTDDQWQRLQDETQLDLCYYIPKAGRYRGNVFLDQRGLNAVFRVIPEQPPTIAEIGLPNHLSEIATYHQGLVLICGPSGAGKSTTLAALVNLFNETRHDHIITLEDPVEFVHPFKNCLINQREVGSDTSSFSRALRAALREDPDVIVIGDLRDNETVTLALTAAETGHIVLATLNATSAHKAVDRLITAFPVQEQPQVRAALAESLKFVVSQRLLPSAEPRKLVACFEILKGVMSVANLIREEKTFQIPSIMQIGRSAGMQNADDALKDLVRAGKVTPETAYMAASNRQDFEELVSDEFLESQTFL